MSDKDFGSPQPSDSEEADATPNEAQELPVAHTPRTTLIVDVVRTTLDVLAKNFAATFVVAFLAALPTIASLYLAFYVARLAPEHTIILGYSVTALSFPLMIVALSPLTFARVKGERYLAREAVRQALRGARSGFTTSFGWTLLAESLALPSVALSRFPAENVGGRAAVSILGALWICIGLWRLVATSMAMPAAVLDELPARQATAVSRTMFRDNRVVVLVCFALMTAVAFVFRKIPLESIPESMESGSVRFLVEFLLTVMRQAFVFLALTAFVPTLYLKLRGIRDRVDVGELARSFR